jgi:hypothetical protein
MTHEFAQQDRLTGSHFSRDQHETLLGFNSVNKRRQALEVERVTEKKPRVGRHTEGRLAKPKMTLKHGFMFLRPGKFDHLIALLLKAVIAVLILTNFTSFRAQLLEHDKKFLRNESRLP